MVETHNDFTVYHGDRRRHITELFEFRQRGLISCDISFRVLDRAKVKEQFLSQNTQPGWLYTTTFLLMRTSVTSKTPLPALPSARPWRHL